jgi:hypothetical protein
MEIRLQMLQLPGRASPLQVRFYALNPANYQIAVGNRLRRRDSTRRQVAAGAAKLAGNPRGIDDNGAALKAS